MTDIIAQHIEYFASHAHVWGFIFILVFMAIESSFIPFPSEVVMIPAGFLAFRGELSTGIPWLDLCLAVLFGLAGSLLGAYVNYYLSIWLGRPFLHKYGKYFFLKEPTLDRAEEIFRKYGDIATFVCRLLPAIRQLISIPAGLSRMPLGKFTLFTGLGAGIWTAILAGVGWYFGCLAGDMSYLEMVHKGKDLIAEHSLWILIGLVLAVLLYMALHALVMRSPAPLTAARTDSSSSSSSAIASSSAAAEGGRKDEEPSGGN